MGRLTTIAAIAVAAALLAGCGGDDEPTTTTTGPVETADRAKLPRAWTRHANFDAGVSVGVPPLWSARDDGITTTLRSPDKLLAMTITADRTTGAIAFEIGDFLSAVADALPGYEGFSAGPPTAFNHRYAGLAIEGEGTAVDGPAQDVLLVVLSREGLVKVTALASWNRAKARALDIRDARQILRTIRTRPVA